MAVVPPPAGQACRVSRGAPSCAVTWSRLAAAGVPVLTLLCGLVLAAVIGIAGSAPASAQGFTYNPNHRSRRRLFPPMTARCSCRAVEVDYDYNNQRVSAVGDVQLFYNGTSVEADKVIYDQKTKRLHAEGNIRMTDAEGKITYANVMDFSDDYRDGFVNSLRLDTADATRMAATRMDRSSGNYTVFENGVYTACAPCKDDREEAAAVAGQGRAHHSRPDREDALLRERAAGILRRSDGVSAVYVDARSHREAQDRFPDARRHLGVDLRIRCRDPVLLGDRAGLRRDLQSAHHDPAGRAVPGRIPPAAGQRLLPDPRLRHQPARPQRLHRAARRSSVSRRHRHQGPVCAQRQMGVGLGRRAAFRLLLLLGLQVGPIQGSAGLLPEPADRGDYATLFDRRRQPQLLRRARDLLSQFFG